MHILNVWGKKNEFFFSSTLSHRHGNIQNDNSSSQSNPQGKIPYLIHLRKMRPYAPPGHALPRSYRIRNFTVNGAARPVCFPSY